MRLPWGGERRRDRHGWFQPACPGCIRAAYATAPEEGLPGPGNGPAGEVPPSWGRAEHKHDRRRRHDGKPPEPTAQHIPAAAFGEAGARFVPAGALTLP